MSARPDIKVWDALVRVGHWTLAAGIVATWFVHGKWHEWLGYAVMAVVAVRIVWGLAGSRSTSYARFTQFVRSPAATMNYAKQLVNHSEPRHLGHNPLGGWMIVALLLTIIGVCLTGWLYTTDRFWGEAWVEELHEGLSNVLLALVALHIGGVIFSSLRHGENLVAAMVSGRKRAPREGDVI
jgi:cytochrome b